MDCKVKSRFLGIMEVFMYSSYDVAQRINQSLKKKSLSQKDMLETCKLSKNAISSMLSRGSMLRADNLAKIADYLDCSVDFLLGRNKPTKEGTELLTESDQKLLDSFHLLEIKDQREIIAIISLKLNEAKLPPHE